MDQLIAATEKRAGLSFALRDDEGFTTVGMVVALLVCLSLVFTTSQVYRINSVSAEIQEVADLAALAAQNEVAEFMIVARTCDVVVLSMTLLGVTSYGVGVIAMCVPSAAAFGTQLANFGKKIFEARDRFSKSASEGLSKYQSLLPFLMMASASKVASANGGEASGSYFAVAVPVPFEGKELTACDGRDSDKVILAVEAEAGSLVSNAELAEAAAEQAQDARRRAFEADCGAHPGWCMYERASHLAGLSAEENPLYQSVDAWSFSVALDRARGYYKARYDAEAPASQSVDERANSAIRKAFYGYAVDQLSDAYVEEGDGSFRANIPLLPSDAGEMRVTRLYYDAIWPVHANGESLVMHAWAGCPGIRGDVRLGSLNEAESGSYSICSVCEFDATSVGNVAAASTSIGNGFEHHFRIVAIAAQEYEEAYAEVAPHVANVQVKASELFGFMSSVLEGLDDVRIAPVPPGSQGVVALVVGVGSQGVDGGLTSSLLDWSGDLGPRVAVSGATMVEGSSGEGRSVLAGLLDGFVLNESASSAAGRTLLRAWSALLSLYGEGEKALVTAVEEAVDSVPLATASGLGEWAKDSLDDAIETVGLEPAELGVLKAVVVSTSYVVENDSGSFSRAYESLRSSVGQVSASSPDSLSVLLGVLQSLLAGQIDSLEEGIEVARIDLPWADVEVPISIALPEQLGDQAQGALAGCVNAVGSTFVGSSEERVWQ